MVGGKGKVREAKIKEISLSLSNFQTGPKHQEIVTKNVLEGCS